MNNILYFKRTLRKYIKKTNDKILFIVSHLSLWGKLALFGLWLCFISLFFPWFTVWLENNANDYISSSAFSSLIWYIGYLYLATIVTNIFYVLSIKNKAKIRYVSWVNISTSHIIVLTSLCFIISAIHVFFLIWGMRFFRSEIFHQQGLILFLTGSIIVFIAGKILKNEEIKNISGSYSYSWKIKEIETEKIHTEENMKLPI